MKKHGLPILLIALFTVLLVALLLWEGPQNPEQEPGPDKRPQGGDFRLVGSDGPLALGDLRGQVVVLYFGYTWCPDICPTSLAALAAALNELDAAAQNQVQGLFVSVDPKRDSVQRLAEYTAYFHPRIRGLTTDPETLAQVARQYGAAFRKVETEDENYPVDHSADLYLIDRQGQLRETLPHGTPPRQILAALRGLLSEPAN